MQRKLIWFPDTARTEDINDDQYFQDEPWKDYISNSKLNLVDPSTGGSIKLFEKSFKSTRRSKAFQTGTIVHSLLLQADNYGVSDIIRPTGKLGDMVYDLFKIRSREDPPQLLEAINMVLKYHNYYKGKQYVPGTKKKPTSAQLTKALREGLPYYAHLRLFQERDFILSSEEVNIVLGCLDSLKLNEKAMEVLFPKDPNVLRFNEMAMACDVKLTMERNSKEVSSTQYTLKAKIDNWTLDLSTQTATLNDLKTTGTGLQNFVDGYWEVYPTATEDIRIFHPGSFQKYKYYRQLAMYAKILSLYVEKEYGFKPKVNINIVAVETREPYWSETFNFGSFDGEEFTTRQLNVGLQDMEDLLWILKDNDYVSHTEGFIRQPCAFI